MVKTGKFTLLIFQKRGKMRNKGQVALEFLTTYAWAFILILITIGALYYFGVFDFDKYLPQKCTFPSQFECLDFNMRDTEIRFKLHNDISEDLYVRNLSITNDANPPIICDKPLSFPPLGDWEYDEERDFVFSNCTSGGFVKGERIEVKINITYYAVNTPSQPNHTINGKITGIIG